MLRLGATFGPARRVPHVLTTSQKSLRVTRAGELLQHLKNNKYWPYTLTVDESWFYFSNEPTQGWTFPGDEPITRVDRQLTDRKLLFVVFFSTTGFKTTHFVPSGTTLNAQYFQSLFEEMGANFPRPLWIHMDNVAPHRAKTTQNTLSSLGISTLTHPPYSPDLAPSDFWLFGRIKQALGRTHFSTAGELGAAVLGIIDKIGKAEIKKVYNEWVLHLQACIDNGGEYVHITQ